MLQNKFLTVNKICLFKNRYIEVIHDSILLKTSDEVYYTIKTFFKYKLIFLMFILLLPLSYLFAQDSVREEKKYVNEVKTYITPGGSTVYGNNIGFSGLYTRHLTDRIDVSGGIYFSTKRKIFFSSLNIFGSYRFPLSKSINLYANAKINWTDYSEFHLNEYVYRMAVKFESNYIDLELGNCVFNYTSYGEHQTEAYNPSFAFNVRFNKLTSPFYVGLFIRNYDDFYFDNYNVIWGLNSYYRLNKRISLLGELNIQPAGNMSQLATKYAYYFKLGGIYKW
jgi:hypothetical protein